jgi:hypothetical protein
VPATERIAVFDNDGTLWSEQPLYVQFAFVMDRVRALAPRRPWAERICGIPPEQVIGSRGKLEFQLRDAQPVLLKLADVDLVDDHEGKLVGIQQAIGRRPLAAFGNSDGDLQMLQWTTAGEGPRFALLLHYTDADREWAYDRESHVGKLDEALDEGLRRGLDRGRHENRLEHHLSAGPMNAAPG